MGSSKQWRRMLGILLTNSVLALTLESCEDLLCPPYSECRKVGAYYYCQCPQYVDSIDEKVCGSNGKFYANIDELKLEACQSNQLITLQDSGLCLSKMLNSSNPCQGLNCRYYSQCHVDSSTGTASCRCNTDCPSIFTPVCGSDKMIYPNICEMEKYSCSLQIEIEVTGFNKCNAMDSGNAVKQGCQNHDCGPYQECVDNVFNNGYSCKCLIASCSANANPVCGSNGITYNNQCELILESCHKDKSIVMVHDGQCKSSFFTELCNPESCKFNGVCAPHPFSGIPTCQCIKQCGLQHEPVCGTDGKKYPNLCHMEMASCFSQAEIAVATNESCEDISEQPISSFKDFQTYIPATVFKSDISRKRH